MARRGAARAAGGRRPGRHPGQAPRAGHVGGPVRVDRPSWGSGKDWRVWSGEQVADFVDLNDDVVRTALDTVDKARAANRSDWRDPNSIDWRDPRGVDWRGPRGGVELRDATNDQLLREALLTVASDWVFMISKDSAAGYARDRAHLHAHATREIADAVSAGHRDRARRIAEGWRGADYLFPRLDARRRQRHDCAGMR